MFAKLPLFFHLFPFSLLSLFFLILKMGKSSFSPSPLPFLPPGPTPFRKQPSGPYRFAAVVFFEKEERVYR